MQILLSRKRSRDEWENPVLKTDKSPPVEWKAEKGDAPAMKKPNVLKDDCNDLFEIKDTNQHRPLGIFEFPWQKEPGGLAPELERYSLRDVFFSSLVDGCSATIGFPGDRLSRPSNTPIVLPESTNEPLLSEEDAAEFESIWGSILRQPLSVVYCPKTPGA